MENAKLTLYFIPSPFGLNWKSPTQLARTIVLNKYSFLPRFMGHVNIEIEFINEDQEKIHILTGMVAAKLDAVDLLVKKHMGLGVLWHSFPGRLETKEELIPELSKYMKTGRRLNFMSFNISHKAASKLYDYYDLYKQNQIQNFYGLVNSPLHGEGAGCSAFGASFLSVAGLLDQDFIDNCSLSVKAPLKLIGAPITKNEPNFVKMLFNKENWASETEEYKEIFFWDPDLMFKYVNKLFNEKSNRYKNVHKNLSRGIEFNYLEASEDDQIFHTDIKSTLPDLKKKSNKDYFDSITQL